MLIFVKIRHTILHQLPVYCLSALSFIIIDYCRKKNKPKLTTTDNYN